MYSEAISKLIGDLQNAGVIVDAYADLPSLVAGRCHYPDEPGGPRIEINVANAKMALMVLAHEMGHLKSWYALGGRLPEDPVERERLAWIYGWGILKPLRIISGHDWEALRAEAA